ncbi:pilus assembly FimT family protein [Piscinibacter sakaiensis]|uniref:pilus assembly FimT family protein n=1 Tax=Piscinibacter sakaiensis TaxID=1547922 RepID=UPI003AAAB03F
MRISAPGSEHGQWRLPASGRAAAAGFTLVELIVVIAIIALAAGVLSLALRNPADTQLEREAARLSALLEAARTEARSLGAPVVWYPVDSRSATGNRAETAHFRFEGLPEDEDLPNRWLDPATTADITQGNAIVLGPEPLIGAQRIVLRLEQRRIVLDTDGLGPFIVRGIDDADRATPRF